MSQKTLDNLAKARPSVEYCQKKGRKSKTEKKKTQIEQPKRRQATRERVNVLSLMDKYETRKSSEGEEARGSQEKSSSKSCETSSSTKNSQETTREKRVGRLF